MSWTLRDRAMLARCFFCTTSGPTIPSFYALIYFHCMICRFTSHPMYNISCTSLKGHYKCYVMLFV